MRVVTIGMGYIGLPTSALIASKEIYVTGIDINQDVVDTINRGMIHIVEPELDKVVKETVRLGYLRASIQPEAGDIYLIVVPTPFKENYEADISCIEKATQSIIPFLKENDLYVIESTSPIGTTEKMAEFIFSQRPELEKKIHIAYCPERVLPGNVMHELVHNDRIVGGIDDGSTRAAVNFYELFVKGEIHKTNSKTAEMCKLVENSSRDVQIAFANELSFICEKADINVWELIELANKHPRVSILQPGCGVGGHCIAVDPYFIVSDYPKEAKIINKAREVNNFKPQWCINIIEKEIKRFESQKNSKPVVAFLGLSFKPNIDDLRESPALSIVNSSTENIPDDKYFIVEPNLTEHQKFRLVDVKYAIDKSDLIVVLVNHNEFKELDFKSKKVLNFVSNYND